ncbi:TIGR04290 family methyltransferase [Rhizobium sp. L1K21]|nr:TIGR04290 family methyltransferase [Rhizobium sp. L1K21]
MSSKDLKEQINALGPWFHNMTIQGVETAPDHFLGDYPRNKWQAFEDVIPRDLEGCSVLDIGCNAGFYALEMKRRNAGRVVGIDTDARYLAQARFAAEQCGADIEFRQMSTYDLRQFDEKFDLVIFMGVLYHLRHPLLALDLLYETVVGKHLLFQSMQRGSADVGGIEENDPFSEENVFHRPDYPKLHFVEHRYADDPTNWFIPNKAAVEAMLRSAGFKIEANPEEEVYLCSRGERHFAAEPPPLCT